MKANYFKHTLNFKQPSGTSRGILTTKETWFLKLQHNQNIGIGECGILRGLSVDDRPNYEQQLQWVCSNIHLGLEVLLQQLTTWPSIQFGLEQAFLSVNSKSPFHLFPSTFTKGQHNIPINGLVWMGDEAFMRQQIKAKINAGFTCIKLKIGAINFQTELNILKSIRKQFSVNDIQLRVDANGAFAPNEALEKLKRLSEYQLHSIEQPIQPQQLEAMAQLCATTPLPIALDEELIGVYTTKAKKNVLQTIQPQYIILKPSLIGGYQGSTQWVKQAESFNIKWWVTSALESNVGLNAIAQWTFTLNNPMPQGLGTGSLFTNNINAPLQVTNGNLHYNPNLNWDFNF